jgi:hypothetical protein
MDKKILLILLLFFVCNILAFAEKPPTMPNSYDSIGVSARGFAMGHAGVALPGSLDGVFYNSASLGFNNNENIQIEATSLIIRNTDLGKTDLSYANPIDLGFTSIVINQKQGAISWRTFSANSIELRNGNDFYKKDENIKAVTISAASVNKKGVSFGLNLSYLYGTLAESSVANGKPFAQTSSGNGFTMDIGIMTPIKGNLYAGVNFENIFGIMWWEHYDFDQLPFGMRAGLGYILGSFNLIADWNKKFYRFGNMKNDNLFSVGIEQSLGNILVLRVGAQGSSTNEKEKIKYTYGLGLNISIFSLSVAGENYKLNNESVSKYGLSLKLFI